jgi:hypothetical protein
LPRFGYLSREVKSAAVFGVLSTGIYVALRHDPAGVLLVIGDVSILRPAKDAYSSRALRGRP